ncbi:PREDICTED: pentatricopeptide repeat-containing protein At2g13600-like [Nelumbo nucifera]|nr:PREDICTED: pentatricopeptide repeat-containing protein At2g13600-like [Nelumbo nucifera]
MTERNLFSWTAIIGAYCNSGEADKAFDLYKKMITEGFRADQFLYPLILKSCAGMKSLRGGQQVHADIFKSGFQWDVVITNSLINMYSKSETVEDAKRAFDEMVTRDIFTWTSMLVGYIQMGDGLQALKLFKEMMHSAVRPNPATLAGILPLFSDLGSFELAKQIHGLIVTSGFEYDKFVGTALIDVYANCGGLGYGRLIFNRVKDKDIVCWNTMVKGYAQINLFEEAVELLRCMHIDGKSPNITTWDCIIPQYLESGLSIQNILNTLNQLELSGIRPSEISLTSLYQICERVEGIEQVREFHWYLSRCGYMSDSAVASYLISMYSKFACVEDGENVFEGISSKELDCWNSMIACYSYNGYASKAFELFNSMQKAGIEPSTLSWNTVIAGFIDAGDFWAALDTFATMRWTYQKPDHTIFSAILPVVGHLTCPMTGKQLHSVFLRNVGEMNTLVCTAFINMYGNCGYIDYSIRIFESIDAKDLASWNSIISGLAKSGFLDEASRIFNEMKMTGVAGNIITWTTLVSAYARHGEVDECLKHFRELQLEGLKPNSITISSILPACSQSAILSHGKSIHCYIIRSGIGYEDLFVANALIDMFVKCGSMEYAERVFRGLPRRDIVSWNTMIQGFTVHGKANAALSLFYQMLEEGVDPDSITFLGVLSACSQAGLAEEGWRQFNNMDSRYGIIPTGKHYTCMVDLLGRVGNFEDVRNFIVQMPLQPTASLWGALLLACKTHQYVEMAEYAANHLIELQPQNPVNYVTLIDIYATAGRWNDVNRVRKMMVDNGVKELPGCSWIEVGNSIRAFTEENQLSQDVDEDLNSVLVDLLVVITDEEYTTEIRQSLLLD